MWLFGFGSQPRQRFKRKEERFRAELLTTPMGLVKDLSAAGVCIAGHGRSTLKSGQFHWVKLQSPHGSLVLKGRVAWVRKVEKGFEAGFAFLDVKPAMASALRQLGQFGFIPSGSDADDAPAEAAERAPDPAAAATARAKRGAKASSQKVSDAYAVLKVAPDASDEQIRSSYRRLVRMFHPDVNKSPDAASQFVEVVAAYKALKRERLRLGEPDAQNE